MVVHAVILIVALIVGLVAHQYSGKNDSVAEELAEMVIKDETGLVYDFSKEDKEKATKSD